MIREMSDMKKKKDKDMEDMKKYFRNLFEEQASQIKSLATRGSWCAYKNGPWTSVGTITYDRLSISDTNNMDITGTPLDINSGFYAHKCYNLYMILIFVTFQGSSLCPCLEPGG